MATDALSALMFLLPALIVYAAYVLYPIGNALVLSLFKWDGISPHREFVGFDNYVTVLTNDSVFWRALKNTWLWTILSLTFPTTLGLVFALALNRPLIGKTVFRTVFYLPAVLATVVVAIMWAWIYNPYLGLANAVLNKIGQPAWIQDWLGDQNIALYSVFVASVWQSSGTNMLLFLAGLQGVPHDLVEAAKVDGANSTSVFRHVVIPALRPTIVVVISLTIINSLKVFDLVYAMTYGGPGHMTQVITSWSYFQAFNFHNFGIGMAVASILFAITLLIIVPYLVWIARKENA